jgi:hypothetical protein
MNDSRLAEWLLGNAGSIIRYRTTRELCDGASTDDDLLKELLNEDKVKSLLLKLEAYGPISKIDNRTLNAVHTGPGVEGYVGKLLEFGLTKDIKPFDERMRVFRQYVDNEWVHDAWNNPHRNDVGGCWAIFIAVLLSSFLIRAGYCYRELSDFIEKRINALYTNASEKIYNIHFSNSELEGMA